jgi:hypothetical protein
MHVMVMMVMVVVTMMMVARTRVGGHGEHRQHGGDGDELGQGHGELLSSRVIRPERGRAGIMPQIGTEKPRPMGIVPGLAGCR